MKIREIVRCVVLVCLSFSGEAHADQIKEDPTRYMEVVGRSIKMYCSANVPSYENLKFVIWYKENEAIYSYDPRGRTHGKHWSQDTPFGGRAQFEPNENRSYLFIEDLRTTDEGNYTCRMEFDKSIIDEMVLKVIVPPSLPIVRRENGEVLRERAGPYEEGETIILVCEVTGGKPSPQITWWKGDIKLNNTENKKRSTGRRSTLTYGPLTRANSEDFLICQASNSPLVQPISKGITLDIYYKPLSVNIEQLPYPLTYGTEYQLRCLSAGSRPPAIITWWLSGAQLTDAVEMHHANGTESILTFSPAIEDDEKRLTCRAEHGFIVDSVLEDFAAIDIHYEPQVRLLMDTFGQVLSTKEGNNVYLECQVDAKPTEQAIEWYYKGTLIQREEISPTGHLDRSFTLTSVSRTQSGIYTCSATNIVGTGASNPVVLEIRHKPSCYMTAPKIIGVGLKEEISISCKMDATPAPVSFVWKLNTSQEIVDFPTNQYDVRDKTSTLTFMPRNQYDFGTLYCYSTNVLGESKQPCIFEIIPAEFPESPKNCIVANQTWSSFIITCEEGYDGGMPQFFVAEIIPLSYRRHTFNETNDIPVFYLEELKPGSDFLIRIFSVNDKGPSNKTIVHTFTLQQPRLANASHSVITHIFPITPILAVLIGVVLALVVGGIIVFIVLRLRTCNEEFKNADAKTPLTNENGSSGIVQPNKAVPSPIAEVKAIDLEAGIPSKLKHANLFETKATPKPEKDEVKGDASNGKPKMDVEYAELCFEGAKNKTKAKPKKSVPKEETIYASIDHKKTDLLCHEKKNDCELPKTNHTLTVDRFEEESCSKTPKDSIPLIDASLETNL